MVNKLQHLYQYMHPISQFFQFSLSERRFVGVVCRYAKRCYEMETARGSKVHSEGPEKRVRVPCWDGSNGSFLSAMRRLEN